MIPLIIYLGTTEMIRQYHALLSFNMGKEPVATTEWVVGWVPEMVWAFWKRGRLITPAESCTIIS